MEEPNNITRLPGGRFAPGQSGNPSGRPKSANTLLRERFAIDGEKVAEAVITAALNGDMIAARMILDRLVPPLKPNAAPVTLSVNPGATPLAVAEAIVQAAAGGQIAPDIAAHLITATAQLCRIVEIEDLRARLEAIERATKSQKTKKQ